MIWKWIGLGIVVVGLFLWIFTNQPTNTTAKIRYAVIGDSYSNGEGAYPEQSWPQQVTDHLQKDGVDIALVSNPSITGWTTQQAIDSELPAFEGAKPTFATLQIGVNDWVQGVDEKTFRKNLIFLLTRMQAVLPNKQHIILVTIPDFSVTPTGNGFAGGRNISAGIASFNRIIIDEAKKRNLPVVDVFPLSKDMGNYSFLVAKDGLHPSAREYKLWEEKIYPVARDILEKEK